MSDAIGGEDGLDDGLDNDDLDDELCLLGTLSGREPWWESCCLKRVLNLELREWTE